MIRRCIILTIVALLGYGTSRAFIHLRSDPTRSPLQPLTASEHSVLPAQRSPTPLFSHHSEIASLHALLELAAHVEQAPVYRYPRLLKNLPASLRPALIELWSRRDPEGFARFLSMDNVDVESGERLFANWMRRAPHRALQYLEENQEQLHHWNPVAVRAALALDPSLGFQAMRRLQIANPGGPSDMFAPWAKRDPEAALRALDGLSSNRKVEAALTEIGKAWGKQDPREALNHTAHLPIAQASHMQEAVMHVWAQQDLTAATGRWMREADPFTKANLRNGIISGLLAMDPEAAEQWKEANAHTLRSTP